MGELLENRVKNTLIATVALGSSLIASSAFADRHYIDVNDECNSYSAPEWCYPDNGVDEPSGTIINISYEPFIEKEFLSSTWAAGDTSGEEYGSEASFESFRDFSNYVFHSLNEEILFPIFDPIGQAYASIPIIPELIGNVSYCVDNMFSAAYNTANGNFSEAGNNIKILVTNATGGIFCLGNPSKDFGWESNGENLRDVIVNYVGKGDAVALPLKWTDDAGLAAFIIETILNPIPDFVRLPKYSNDVLVEIANTKERRNEIKSVTFGGKAYESGINNINEQEDIDFLDTDAMYGQPEGFFDEEPEPEKNIEPAVSSISNLP